MAINRLNVRASPAHVLAVAFVWPLIRLPASVPDLEETSRACRTPECAHMVSPRARVDDHMLICAAHEVLAAARVSIVDGFQLSLARGTVAVRTRTVIP